MTGRRIAALLGRSAVVVATILLAVGFVLASWAPLSFEPPVRVDNRLEVHDDRLVFTPVSLAVVPGAAAVIRAADPGDELVLRLRLRPALDPPPGLARIVVLGTDLRNHDLLVGQEGDDLVVRREQTFDGLTQEGEVRLAGALDAGRWQDVEVRFAEEASVSVGSRSATRAGMPGPQGRTARAATLALGAETSGNHPWAGEIATASLRVGQQHLDLLDPAGLRRPARVWLLPERLDESGTRRPSDHLATAGWHLLTAVLLGVGTVLSLPRLHRATAAMVVWAVVVAVVNLTKIVIESRHPSLAVALLQAAGGWLGIVAAVGLRRQRLRRRGTGGAAPARSGGRH